MLKEMNILGIRKKVVLSHFKKNEVAVMIPATKELINNIEKNKMFNTDKETITKNKIYLYGDVNIKSTEDCNIIKKLCPMSDDLFSNWVYINFNYDNGIVTQEDGMFKQKIEIDIINWFKYNYCLLGKPEYIILYKTTISKL